MKATRITSSILILTTIVWISFLYFKLSNNNIEFSELNQIPIALAFFVSLVLLRLNSKRNAISLIFYSVSLLILALGFFSLIPNESLFKAESIILLFSGAFTFYSMSKSKNSISILIYFGTAILFSITLVFEISTPILQVVQVVFGISTSILALISSYRSLI